MLLLSLSVLAIIKCMSDVAPTCTFVLPSTSSQGESSNTPANGNSASKVRRTETDPHICLFTHFTVKLFAAYNLLLYLTLHARPATPTTQRLPPTPNTNAQHQCPTPTPTPTFQGKACGPRTLRMRATAIRHQHQHQHQGS